MTEWMNGAGGAAREREPSRRRYLTLLFADLSGSTRLGSELEAEHYAALLDALAAAYRDAITAHGGLVVRIAGDGVLAIFGHPETLEDDGRRAVEAAIDLHAAVRMLRPDPPLDPHRILTMHSGIHAGLVLVGTGDAVRGLYELMGHAPNIAARIADAAGPDEILVSEDTLGPEAERFIIAERRELLLAGTLSPLSALRIAGRVDPQGRHAARTRRSLPGFVGRHAELEALDAALDSARTGQVRRVALVGAPGLGKTRLAQVFLERCTAHGCDVLQACCEGEALAAPLQPFLQMLRDRLGVDPGAGTAQATAQLEAALRGIDPGLLEYLPTYQECLAIAAPVAPKPGRRAPLVTRLRAAMSALVERLAATAPVVVFIDDWQGADDASHHLLSSLFVDAGPAVLVILATRGFSAADAELQSTFRRVDLSPLPHEQAALTVHRLLPAADPFLVDEICVHAGGNPLFIEELCHRALRDPRRRQGGAAQEGAAWLNLLIESRVSRLPEPIVALVRSAAVLGNAFPGWLFEAVTGCGDADPRLLELARNDLIFAGESPGTLRFKHAITRDVVYRSVGLHQRRALHRSVADALLAHAEAPLGASDSCELLAYHLANAGDHAQAAKYAVMAGDRAVAVSAVDRAQAQYRTALVALDRPDMTTQAMQQWLSIAQRLGLACVFDPTRGDLPLFERALDLARQTGDPASVARAQYWLGYIRYALGDQREALRYGAEASLAAERAGDDRLRIQVQATLGQMLAAAGKNSSALSLLEQAVEVKRRNRTGGSVAVGLTYSLTVMAQALADLGRFDEAHSSFAEALDLLHGVPHEVAASVHGVRAAVLLWQGRWAEAQEAAVLAFRIGQKVRSLFTLTMGRAAGAYADWMLRGAPSALDDMLDATAWLVPRGNALFRSFNHGWLADALVSAGRFREARHHAAAALQRARQRDLLGAPMACRALARAAASEHLEFQARRWLARALATGASRQSAHERAVTQWCEAEVEFAFGRPAHAAALLRAAHGEFERMGMVWHALQAEGLARRL